MRLPLISIVTITYNNYKELLSTLDSFNESEQVETIVVNGGSCSRTKKFLDSNNIISISESDKGISDAFNKGAKLAKGEYILFLNSGDVVINSYIETLTSEIARTKKKLYCNNIIYDSKEYGQILFKSSLPKLKKLWRGMPFPHPCLCINLDIFKKTGYFKLDYSIGMDFEWICRLSKIISLNDIFYIDQEAVLMDGGGISSLNDLESLKENLRALRENNLSSFKSNLYFFWRFIRLIIKKVIPSKVKLYLKTR